MTGRTFAWMVLALTLASPDARAAAQAPASGTSGDSDATRTVEPSDQSEATDVGNGPDETQATSGDELATGAGERTEGDAGSDAGGREAVQPDEDGYRLDFAVPDAPAFTILGVSPTTVSRPRTYQELTVALASGIRADGRVQGGLAVEYAPTSWFALSVATNVLTPETPMTDAAAQAAIGTRFTFYAYDPSKDRILRSCISQELVRIRDETPPDPVIPEGAGTVTVSPERPAPAAERCRDLARSAHLARHFFEGAVAVSAEAPNSAPGDGVNFFGVSGWVHWTFLALNIDGGNGEDPPISNPGAVARAVANRYGLQVVGFNRYLVQRYATADSYRFEFAGGLRVELFADAWNVFLEGTARPPVGGDVDAMVPLDRHTSARVALGGEFRMSNGTWLSLAFAADLMEPTTLQFEPARFFALANFHWTSGERPLFAPAP